MDRAEYGHFGLFSFARILLGFIMQVLGLSNNETAWLFLELKAKCILHQSRGLHQSYS